MDIDSFLGSPVLFGKLPVEYPDETVFVGKGECLDDVRANSVAITFSHLPCDIANLRSFQNLRYLNSFAMNDELLACVAGIDAIEFLQFSYCKLLHKISTRAKYISLFRCSLVNNLQVLDETIEGLAISDCDCFLSFEALSRFSALKEVVVTGSLSKRPVIKNFALLARLSRLEYFATSAIVKSDDLPALQQLPSLKKLWIPGAARAGKKFLNSIFDSCPLLDEIDLGSKLFTRECGYVDKFDDSEFEIED